MYWLHCCCHEPVVSGPNYRHLSITASTAGAATAAVRLTVLHYKTICITQLLGILQTLADS